MRKIKHGSTNMIGSISANCFAIEHLVCEYMMNGALSPSKDNASSHLKVNPLSGLTFTILYLTAETPTASAIPEISSSDRSSLKSLTTAAAVLASQSSSMNTTFPLQYSSFLLGSDEGIEHDFWYFRLILEVKPTCLAVIYDLRPVY